MTVADRHMGDTCDGRLDRWFLTSLRTDFSTRRTPGMIPSTSSSRGANRWVPERLWWRLVGLGKAYQVHLLPLLPGATEPQFLSAQQTASLLDEVQFLADVVDDDLIVRLVADLVALLIEAQQQSGENALGIQGA
jgi:hypothetical protein